MCVTVLPVSASTHVAACFCDKNPVSTTYQSPKCNVPSVPLATSTAVETAQGGKTTGQRFASVQALVQLLTAVVQAAQPGSSGLLPCGPSTESSECVQLLGPAGGSLVASAPPSVPHLACPSLVLSSQLLVSERYMVHQVYTHDTRLIHTWTDAVTHDTGNPGTAVQSS